MIFKLKIKTSINHGFSCYLGCVKLCKLVCV